MNDEDEDDERRLVASKPFIEWLHSQGTTTSSLEIGKVKDQGLGLVATSMLPKGSVILRLPARLIISAEAISIKGSVYLVLP